jgi:hypothetical protein
LISCDGTPPPLAKRAKASLQAGPADVPRGLADVLRVRTKVQCPSVIAHYEFRSRRVSFIMRSEAIDMPTPNAGPRHKGSALRSHGSTVNWLLTEPLCGFPRARKAEAAIKLLESKKVLRRGFWADEGTPPIEKFAGRPSQCYRHPTLSAPSNPPACPASAGLPLASALA